MIVDERSDEDHAVPSVMKITEKLTDEEVETDVDETHCPQQLADVSVPPQLVERIVEGCHSIPRERLPERIVAQIVNMSEHTQVDGEDHQRFSISRSKLRMHRTPRLSQDTIQQ